MIVVPKKRMDLYTTTMEQYQSILVEKKVTALFTINVLLLGCVVLIILVLNRRTEEYVVV